MEAPFAPRGSPHDGAVDAASGFVRFEAEHRRVEPQVDARLVEDVAILAAEMLGFARREEDLLVEVAPGRVKIARLAQAAEAALAECR